MHHFWWVVQEKRYWAENETRADKEALAQVAKILYKNDPEAVGMLKTLFPQYTRKAIKALERESD